MQRSFFVGSLLALSFGCADSSAPGDDEVGASLGLPTESSTSDAESGDSQATTESSDSAETSGTRGESTSAGDDDGEEDEGTTTGGVKFDMGIIPDSGEPPAGPIIPETCDQAAAGETTVGCLFYSVDLDQNGPLENDQFAVAVSNVQTDVSAEVTIEGKVGGVWQVQAGPQLVAPLDLAIFPLPNNNQQGSGVKTDGTWRISSDVPIIAYQFNPLIQGAASSDASMLYPVPSWDYINQVIHWGGGYGRGYVTIVAAVDGTVVTVTPNVPTAGGAGVPAGTPGQPFTINLQEGEIAEVTVATEDTALTGTKVVSDEDHPIAVFSGHECANIPTNVVACDHIEEQLAGVRLWGTNFAAARVPVRQPAAPESALWQILASEDGTTVTITADAQVTGLPATPAVLNQGQQLEFYATGPAATPGDLLIAADKPIAVAQYMTGFGNLQNAGNLGDPAMVQLAPFEQFLPRYVVLVPNQWLNDVLVLTKPAGAEVSIDGQVVAQSEFLGFGDGAWEAARVTVDDGVHQLEGSAPFSVVVVGYDGADSYAYLGGSSTGKINPAPQG